MQLCVCLKITSTDNGAFFVRRRRSPLSHNKKIQSKVIKHNAFSSLTSFGSSASGKQQEMQRLSPVNSVVKFGKTPSWK
jgi:hypothetical protein